MLKYLNKLDWERILNCLSNFICSEFSKSLSQKLTPIFSYEEAIKAQEKTRFVWKLLEKGENLELNPLKSLRNLFDKALKRGFFLPVELVEIKKWFIALKKIIPYLENSPFNDLKTLYENIKEIEFQLDKILDWAKSLHKRAFFWVF